jgi:hypothetical protein
MMRLGAISMGEALMRSVYSGGAESAGVDSIQMTQAASAQEHRPMAVVPHLPSIRLS